MTKQDLQQELKEKVKAGIKPSDLKKLKRSKSADDIPSSFVPNIPLQKSKSQLAIPLPNEPSLTQQISSLQDEITTERKKTDLLREDLSSCQEKNKQSVEKITSLEEQILQLRLDKIKEFGDYWEKKSELTQELDDNIIAGTEEINRLEKQLLTVNKKRLELAQKLGTAERQVAQLELQRLDKSETSSSWWSNYKWLILVVGLYCYLAWLNSKE